MKIITGRAKTGKTQYIYDQIESEIKKDTGENLILLVPDLMTYDAEYDIIENLELEGIMNLEILSFKRLAHKIIDESGPKDNIDNIDELGKIMILKEIFDENICDLKLFKKPSSHTGLLSEFSRIIKELKQNLITVDSLEKAIKNIDNNFLKDKLSDISLIYSKYQEKTKDKFFDQEDIYEFVISNIEESHYIKNSRIWIDGFESFNQQRLKMIKVLGENSKDLVMSLNIDQEYLDDLESFDDWEVFKTIYDTYNSIESVVEDIELISIAKKEIESEEIRIIEKNMFAIDLQEYHKPTNNIEIYTSRDPYSEIEETAEKIISLVRDQNYRWKDIKIATTDLDNYMVDIKKVFDRFEIPYFADVKRDIGNNPLCKYILSILDMFIWNFRYDDVFQYLKTGFSPLDNNQVDFIENYALEYGIEGGKWFKTINFNFMEDIRKILISDFEGRRNEFEKLSTIGEITGFLLDYMKLHRIDQQIDGHINRFKIEEKYEQVSEYSQVWNNVMEIFEEILSMGQDREITPREYREILENGFMEREISIIPPTIDRIEIGDIERVAVSKTKALFILGANEGSLDSNKLTGLLLDEDIESLSDNNIEIINCSDFLYFKKKHMLYKIFTNPSQKLYISHPLGGRNGKSLQPSMYINILQMIFPKIKLEEDIENKSQSNYILDNGASYDNLIENINKHIQGEEIDPIWSSVYAWYEENNLEKYNMIQEAFNYKNEIPQVSEEDINKIFDEEIHMTVSKLESYAQCPFKYFVHNILKPKPREIQKIEFYDIGNIYHGVLEDFIDKIIVRNINIKDLKEEDVDRLVEESIEDVFDEFSKKVTALDANNRNSYLKNKLGRVLKRSASIIIKQLQRGEFTPRYTELKIGIIDEKSKDIQRNDYIDSLELETENHKIKLRGIIDRVDGYEDENGEIYINIIDYKSSEKDIDPTDTYEGFQVQLLVYLKAILENGEKLFGKKPKVAGAYYYRVDDPLIQDVDEDLNVHILKSLKLRGLVLKDREIINKVDKEIQGYSDIVPVRLKADGDFAKTPITYTEDEIDAILNYINYKITALSEDILDGEFHISPYRKKDGSRPCKYCEYISVCQFDEGLGNEYRQIASISKKDFLDKISEKAVD